MLFHNFRHKGFLKDCPNGLLTEKVILKFVIMRKFALHLILIGFHPNLQAVLPTRRSFKIRYAGFSSL